MIVYATHAGGKYLPLDESLRVQPEGKRNLYVNITNHCNCACTFCLRTMKHMAEQSSLWFKGQEPTVEEVKDALATVPWDYIKEVVFCGFGEPTMRLDVLLELLRYVKQQHPELRRASTRMASASWRTAMSLLPNSRASSTRSQSASTPRTPSATLSSRARSSASGLTMPC